MNNRQQMRAALRKMYFIMLFPAAAGLTTLELLRQFGVLDGWHLPGADSIQILFFIIAAATAAGIPILYRAVFASSHRGKISIALATLFRFENNLIVVAMLTPWISVVASLFAFEAFFTVGIFLFGLYACYYFYPSQQRMDAEIQMFRVDT
jgi:hypothetical protein